MNRRRLEQLRRWRRQHASSYCDPYRVSMSQRASQLLEDRGSDTVDPVTRARAPSTAAAHLREARQRDGWSTANPDAEKLPDGWEVATAPDGRHYYFAPGPGTTQWTRPLEPASSETSISISDRPGQGARSLLPRHDEEPRAVSRPGLFQKMFPCCAAGTPELMVEHSDLSGRNSGEPNGIAARAPAPNQA